MSKIVVIDPGHGGHDPGAVGNGLREKNLTLDISKRTKRYLDANYKGHKVYLTRTTDKYLTLAQRAKYANSKGADLFVSMHINAGGGTGYESFIHTSRASRTVGAQNNVHDRAVKEMSVTNRGKKSANFAVLRLSNMPAILPENLFIDRKADAEKLKSDKFLNKIAKGHADGIAKALNLKGGNSAAAKPSKPKTSKSKTSGKSISQMATEVIAGKHGSGHSNRKKSLGISNSMYKKVRSEVNARLTGKKPKVDPVKSYNQMANEVIKGLHGNGHTNRRRSLGISRSDYNKVRKIVNTGSAPTSGKSINQMATEIIDGKHGKGHANRRRSLGISQSRYNKVRAEVNRRM